MVKVIVALADVPFLSHSQVLFIALLALLEDS